MDHIPTDHWKDSGIRVRISDDLLVDAGLLPSPPYVARPLTIRERFQRGRGRWQARLVDAGRSLRGTVHDDCGDG